ncbi:MAG TPA: hypothetical protein VFB51_06720 [Solirubrobacterales bacterium]|nr:hypothetical protein [Solirubrobacterales bacterium]
MEGSGAITAAPRRDPATVRLTRAGILIASLGALLVIFNPFGSAIAGLFLAVVGTLLAARGGLGRRWYWALAAGAIIVVLSRLIAEGSEVLGGWLAVIGVVFILVAASLGYPLATDLED